MKVCGLTREEDVDAAVEAGADLAGFILAKESPRPRRGVLDVPETVLSVAVFVGEATETGADLVQLYAREDGHRSRDAVLLRDGEQVAQVVDLPWQEDDPTHLDRAPREVEGRVMLAGGLDAGERRRGDRRRPPVGRRRQLAARVRARGSRITRKVRAFVEAARGEPHATATTAAATSPRR